MPIQYTILIGFLSALISATATLLGVFLSNKWQKERLEMEIQNQQYLKNKELRREKLEEAYLLFKKIWHKEYTDHSGDYQEREHDTARLEMLLELYFPNILVDYYTFENLVKTDDRFINIEGARGRVLKSMRKCMSVDEDL